MFVDACAIVSIITGEETAIAYDAAMEGAEAPFTSPLAAFEAVIVLARPDHLKCSFSEAEAIVVDWLTERRIELLEPTTPREVLSHAISVAEKHGLGKRHLSNFDCFHYAHAKAAGVALLTFDQILCETDVDTLPA